MEREMKWSASSPKAPIGHSFAVLSPYLKYRKSKSGRKWIPPKPSLVFPGGGVNTKKSTLLFMNKRPIPESSQERCPGQLKQDGMINPLHPLNLDGCFFLFTPRWSHLGGIRLAGIKAS